MSEEYDYPKGGGQGYEGDGPNLRLDDFVGRIVQDPNAPPSVTLLSGYLGSSSEEGHVRLYLDEELCRYVEIPEKAIRHTQELPPEQSPLGGSLVWIDRDAEVLHGAAGSERRKATFLEGQIAQDYIGGGGGYEPGGEITTRTADCGGKGGGILPTDMGPGCGQSQCGPCIPPTEQVYCRTLTGIFCTRFGPGCRRTVFEPVCTSFGPNCHTVLVNQCQSVFTPCFTQDQSYCVESGFVGCNGPIDFTIYEQYGRQQFAQQAAFGGGAGGAAGGGQGFAAIPPPTSPAICQSRIDLCPSQFNASCLTRVPNECVFGIPSVHLPCPPPTRSAPNCRSRLVACPPSVLNPPCQVETAAGCISRVNRCPTMGEPRCFASRWALCPDTVAGCQFDTAACGFDPAGGGGPQAFKSPVNVISIMPTVCDVCVVQTQTADCGPTQTPDCGPTQVPICAVVTRTPRCGGGGGGNIATQFCVSHVVRCPSAVDACPSRLCPSRSTPCQSQLVRCPSQLDACPTRYNCPTMTNSGCPGYTRLGACETFGACPSAVDACPTRFGCYETRLCGGESIACYPGGGGGGFDPGAFGGGF